MTEKPLHIPIGTRALILSKLYYGVLSKSLEHLEVERYFSILHYLYRREPISQQTICNDLAIDKTAMVKVLDYLSKAGFIERTVNPKDRREHFITLSKKGEKRTTEIVRTFESIDRHMFAGIPAHEQQIFNKVLQSLSGNLKEMPSNDLFFNYKKTRKTK